MREKHLRLGSVFVIMLSITLLFTFSCNILTNQEVEAEDENNKNEVSDDDDDDDTNNTISDDDDDDDDQINSLIMFSINVHTADDTFLGYCLSASISSISLITEEGYLININWDGSFYDEFFYFTEQSGKGKIFLTADDDISPIHYGKAVYPFMNKFYVAKTVKNGITVIDDSLKQYESVYDYETQSIINESGELYSYEKAFELVEIDRNEIGLPESIPSPLKLVPVDSDTAEEWTEVTKPIN